MGTLRLCALTFEVSRLFAGGRRIRTLGPSFAKHLGVPLLLANVTQQVYQMARAAGLNKEDGSSIIKVFERMAGVTIGDDD